MLIKFPNDEELCFNSHIKFQFKATMNFFNEREYKKVRTVPKGCSVPKRPT